MPLGTALNPLLAADLWQFNPPAHGVRYSAAHFFQILDFSMDRFEPIPLCFFYDMDNHAEFRVM